MVSAATGAAVSPNPFTSDQNFWLAASMMEDVAVTGYAMAAKEMESLDMMTIAGGLLATEAHHAGIVRLKLAEHKGDAQSWNQLIMQTAANLSDWRNVIDGKLDLDQNIVDDPDLAVELVAENLIPNDNRGLVFARNADQMKSIYYAGAGRAVGGFFPNGVNTDASLGDRRRTLLATNAAPLTDNMNLLLNVACLEADFFSWAAFGRGLTPEQSGRTDTTPGGSKLNSNGQELDIAREIAHASVAIVSTLRSTIGSAAVSCPKVDIQSVFQDFVTAAGLSVTDYDPYVDQYTFFTAALILKDVAVSAYRGVIPTLTNKDFVDVASKMMATESYHAGIIRAKLTDEKNERPSSLGDERVVTFVEKISDYRDSMTTGEHDQGIDSGNLVPTDSNGFVFARTPEQVLDVLYMDAAALKGGFFPDGVNGIFNPDYVGPPPAPPAPPPASVPTVVTENGDGTMTSVTTTVNDDGTTTIVTETTNLDDTTTTSTTVIAQDGVKTTTEADGTVIVTQIDGSTVTTNPDGSTISSQQGTPQANGAGTEKDVTSGAVVLSMPSAVLVAVALFSVVLL